MYVQGDSDMLREVLDLGTSDEKIIDCGSSGSMWILVSGNNKFMRRCGDMSEEGCKLVDKNIEGGESGKH